MTATPGVPSDARGDGRFRVLIAGGGVAALETALALRELAGDRVEVTMLAPEAAYVDRPLEVREPFGGAAAPRYDLAVLAADAGAALVVGRLGRVDAPARKAWTEDGEPLAYDALVLALGARPYVRHPMARTIIPGRMDATFRGFVRDVEAGLLRRAAIVIPERTGWLLPAYELVLMAAERADDAWSDATFTLVTGETTPLAAFGRQASAEVAERLADAGVEVITSAHAEVPSHTRVDVARGGARQRLDVDDVLALPELMGPAVRGLPVGAHGFIPVDAYGRVQGEHRVFAAGDATDLDVKHGGVAAQQADVVAAWIAALAGASVEPRSLRADIDGVLLTGGRPLALHGALAGVAAGASSGREVVGPPPPKIAAPRLADHLARHEPLRDA